MLWTHTLHAHGTAGASFLKVKGWKTLFSNSIIRTAVGDFLDARAALVRKMATENCQNLEAYTPCQDKERSENDYWEKHDGSGER